MRKTSKNRIGEWHGVAVDRFTVREGSAAVKDGRFADQTVVLYAKGSDGRGNYIASDGTDPVAFALAVSGQAGSGLVVKANVSAPSGAQNGTVKSVGNALNETQAKQVSVALKGATDSVKSQWIDALVLDLKKLTARVLTLEGQLAHVVSNGTASKPAAPAPVAVDAQTIPYCGPHAKTLAKRFGITTEAVKAAKVTLPATAPCFAVGEWAGKNGDCAKSVTSALPSDGLAQAAPAVVATAPEPQAEPVGEIEFSL